MAEIWGKHVNMIVPYIFGLSVNYKKLCSQHDERDVCYCSSKIVDGRVIFSNPLWWEKSGARASSVIKLTKLIPVPLKEPLHAGVHSYYQLYQIAAKVLVLGSNRKSNWL